MDDRQAYALANPLVRADLGLAAIERYRHIRQRGDGLLVVVILAVDR